MKKLLALSLTFTVGVAVFDLMSLKPEAIHSYPVERVAEVSKLPVKIISYENVPTKKNEDLKPFFDSFSSDGYGQGFSGWFTADKFKGMPEVWTILLDTDYEDSENGKLVWSAMILTLNADGESNDDDNFESVSIKTAGNHLSFTTNKIRGIEYRFDGTFLQNGNDFAQDKKVLKGTLRKVVKGKEISKFTADFTYAEPHCFH